MNPPAITYGSESTLAGSIEWINGLLLGSLAAGLCVLAVAFVGLLMLGGRLPVRQGLRVILGCFILLGAPIIAAEISGAWQQASPPPPDPVAVTEEPRADLPPADYNPYTRASLRRD